MQIGVANGLPLPFTQDEITFDGHAIEVRLVAEDPAAGWLPSTGELEEFEIDDLDGALRIDSGFRAGGTVSSDYDSLLAKVIAHHPDRGVAALQIARAMRTARVVGVATNANMLAATMAEPDYRAAQTFTSYLAEHDHVCADRGPTGDDRLALVVAATLADQAANRAADAVTGFAPSGWRNLRTQGQRRRWADAGAAPDVAPDQLEYVLHPSPGDDRADVLVGPWPEPNADDGSMPRDERRRVMVRVLRIADENLVLELDGHRHVVAVRRHGADRWTVTSAAGSVTLVRVPGFRDHDDADVGGGPVCPLPGTVIAVHVAAGDEVVEGQLLMVVEAMKMEHKITAGADATVTGVRFAVGDRVDSGDLLVALETVSA